jgi:hypothetical protein
MTDDEFNLFAHAYDDAEVRTVDFLQLMNVRQLLLDDGVEVQLQRRILYLQLGEDLLGLDIHGSLWREVNENIFRVLRDRVELSMGKLAGENFLNQLGKLKPRSQLKFIVESYEKLLDEQ